MIHNDPVGLPGLVALAVGIVVFVVALLAARRRRTPEAAASGARSRRSVAGIAVQMLGIFLVGAAPVRVALAADAPLALIEVAVVAALMATAVALFVWATRTMGANWSLVARTRDDHELVETGPFAWVRHPIYTALALFTLAIAVAYGHLSHLGIAAPVYAIGTAMRIREEERLLRTMFGTAYDAYATRVKRFIPGLF